MANYAEAVTAKHLAAREKTPKPKLESVNLKEAENGGVIAKHRMTEYVGHESEHVFGAEEGHKLAAHIEEHLKIKMPKGVIGEKEDSDGKEVDGE